MEEEPQFIEGSLKLNGFMKIKIYFIAFILIFLGCQKDHQITKLKLNGGEVKQFENPFSGKGANYIWDFGDGNQSSEYEPFYSYSTPGTYIVSVTKTRKGKIVNKKSQYLVEVEQLYKPRIQRIDYYCVDESPSWTSYRYNYFYIDLYANFTIEISEDAKISDYSFQATIDGNEMTPLNNEADHANAFGSLVFTDTGFYDLEFVIKDTNGVSGTFDTTIFVGLSNTYLNLEITDVMSTSLGNELERYVFVYREEDMNGYSTVGDKDKIINYLGPSDGPLVNNQGEINDWSFSGWYETFNGIKICSFPSVNSNEIFTVNFPSYESSNWEDNDELYLMVVIVGNNGVAMGEKILNVLPGSVTPTFDINLNFYAY